MAQDAPPLDWDPQDAAFRADPYPLLAELRRQRPVFESEIGFLLTRYDDVSWLLREARTGVRFANGLLPGREVEGPGVAQFMLEQDPPDHTRLRNLVSKAFTPRSTEGWRARTRTIVTELLDRIEEQARGGVSGVDLVAGLALPVPATVICEMLGVPVSDRDLFTQWTTDSTHGLAGDRAPVDVRARAEAAGLELANYFQQLIAERRKSLSEDLLSSLIRAEEEGDRLSGDELLVHCIGLLIAGFETTIGLISNGIGALLRHPDELAALRNDPDLAAEAVEECLRYDGPIPVTPRVLRAPAELHGVRIPAESVVWASLYGANRDPGRFPEPDRFDLNRADKAHFAFGGGTHLCLGTHLARMEGQEAICGLVRRFPDLALVEPDYAKTVWGASLFRVPAVLPVAVGVSQS